MITQLCAKTLKNSGNLPQNDLMQLPQEVRVTINLGLLHLHDVGLAVGDAVVDVVDVGAQGLQLLVQGGQGAVGVGALRRHLLSLSGQSLPPSGQLFPLLENKTYTFIYVYVLYKIKISVLPY